MYIEKSNDPPSMFWPKVRNTALYLLPLSNNVSNNELISPENEKDTNEYWFSPNTSTSLQNILLKFKDVFLRLFIFLLPSPLHSFLKPAHFKPPLRLHPSSYLDGLRGYASLFVFICHYTGWHFKWYMMPYGLHPEGDTILSSPLQLPFLRVIYAGSPMVHIFFVISGFVLSYKPLKLARKHDFAALDASLASSVFRRTMRLFLPTTVSTFIVVLFVQAQWMPPSLAGAFTTFRGQLYDWWNAVRTTDFARYDVHLWTIPTELSHSMLLFLVITGLSRCKVRIRLALLAGIMLYCLKGIHWAAFEFMGGMAIAEIGFLQMDRQDRRSKEGEKTEEDDKITSAFTQIFWLLNFLLALYIAGWPDTLDQELYTDEFSTNTFSPFPSSFGTFVSFPWFAIAALQIVLSCQQMPILQRFFNTGIAQYLGNISYALYLVHGPLMEVFQGKGMRQVWWIVGGQEGVGRRMVAWVVGLLLIGTPVLWASDLFTRAVDAKCVKFARWLEGICFIDSTTKTVPSLNGTLAGFQVDVEIAK